MRYSLHLLLCFILVAISSGVVGQSQPPKASFGDIFGAPDFATGPDTLYPASGVLVHYSPQWCSISGNPGPSKRGWTFAMGSCELVTFRVTNNLPRGYDLLVQEKGQRVIMIKSKSGKIRFMSEPFRKRLNRSVKQADQDRETSESPIYRPFESR